MNNIADREPAVAKTADPQAGCRYRHARWPTWQLIMVA